MTLTDLDRICFPPPAEPMDEYNGDWGWHNKQIRTKSEKDGHIIAYIAYAQPWLEMQNTDFYILRIGTHPEHRRKNIALSLLRSTIEEIQGSDCGHVGIFASALFENYASRQLFRKAGFTEHHLEDGYFDAAVGVRMAYQIDSTPRGSKL